MANGKLSLFTLATAAFTLLVMPDKWGLFRQAFRRGRKARSIANGNFLALLDEPFADVKALIFHQPVRNERLLRNASPDAKGSVLPSTPRNQLLASENKETKAAGW